MNFGEEVGLLFFFLKSQYCVFITFFVGGFKFAFFPLKSNLNQLLQNVAWAPKTV